MLNVGAVRSGRLASDIGHLRGPAAVAALGRTCAHQLREAAPRVLVTLTRALPHPGAHAGLQAAVHAAGHPAAAVEDPPVLCAECAAPVLRVALTTVHEWDEGRWFVADERLGMLGEIERVGSGYRVLHTDDAKGAVFEFESLHVATEYFEEYAEALSL